MKFENTFKCLLAVVPISVAPIAGIGIGEAFIRYGFLGGMGAIALMVVVIMGSLGLYQDFQVKAREDAKRD